MDVKPIRIFLAVATEGSFVRAAEALGLTPASVTRSVAKLEAEFGQQLLVRTTRQVSLTSAGALVAARFGPLLAEIETAWEEVTGAERADRGHLRLNAPISMGMRILPPILAGFRAAYPAITISLTMTDTLVDILSGECDLAVRVSQPPTDKSTIWRKLCLVPRRIVAAPALLDRIGRPDRPEALLPAHCLSYGGERESWALSAGGVRRMVRAGPGLASNNGDLLHALAVAGAGLALLPDFIVSASVAEGRLETVLPDWSVPPLWLTLYFPPYETLPPVVATFAKYFEEALPAEDDLAHETPRDAG